MRSFLFILILNVFPLICYGVEIQPDALILRYPDVSSESVVFVYAGDIWTVPVNGGTARRLSSPSGNEMFPKFSPDGSMIAFSGNYDGNIDVYKMSSSGGPPQRLTHHPDDDFVVEWYPDGDKILYRSQMLSHVKRYNRLFLQPAEGGMPKVLPFYYGELASFNPTGSKIAFQYTSRQLDHWKRYTGGMASDIWIYDFPEMEYKKFTDYSGTDAVPMWYKNTLYFLSDRGKEHKLNIWSYSFNTGELRQVTKFSEFDVKWPSLGPGKIVFENAGNLFLLDLETEEVEEIEVRINYDAPGTRTDIKDLSKYIRDFDISPKGDSALIEARGEIITVRSEDSFTLNHTSSSGVAERYPDWAPNGREVAYFSDKSGEYNLYVSDLKNFNVPLRITDNKKGYYINPDWSPDSSLIAFADQAGNLYLADIKGKKTKIIDTDSRGAIDNFSWSPDSRWLTYSKTDKNGQYSLYVYDVKRDRVRKITSDFYSDMLPVFGKEGKYIYFYSNRSFNPVYSDFDRTWVYPNATQIYVLYLNKDTPFIDSVDEGSATFSESDKKNNDSKKDQLSKSVRIDFEGIQRRLSKLDIDSGNFGRMEAGRTGVYYLRLPDAGNADSKNGRGDLYYYDIERKNNKMILSGIDDFRISHDGSRIIYRVGNNIGIVDSGKKSSSNDGRVDPASLKSEIDPVREWEQIFHEAWRIERDFFYDPNMHGTDWEKIRKRYSHLLPYVTSRHDLNYVIGEMIGELNSSHTYVGGGDLPSEKQVSVGLTGCDFKYSPALDAYVITRIYDGGKISPELRSPLLGKNVETGDLLLEVNGRRMDTEKDPWAAFQGLANRIVSLTIGKSGERKTKITIHVKLLDRNEDLKLRYYSWVDEKRQYVEDATDGLVGYVYVPDTGSRGQSELVRQFSAQSSKKGLIIDERFNSGGQIPDKFVELLSRRIMSYWARRYFDDWKTPELAHAGHKVMIINQWSGSGGDAFPFYFREHRLGKLVGTRTMGALIGITDIPPLIDGGYVTAPGYAFWNKEGEWAVEGEGVNPDYEVEITPTDMVRGLDTQLDKAISVIRKLMAVEPVEEPARPDYRDKKN